MKIWIIEAARASGWTASAEVPSSAGPVDVVCTRGKARVGLQVQYAAKRLERYERDQSALSKEGIRCAWLAKRLPRDLKPKANLPIFEFFPSEERHEPPDVSFGGNRVPLSVAVSRLLGGSVKFSTVEAVVNTHVMLISYPILCPFCRRDAWYTAVSAWGETRHDDCVSGASLVDAVAGSLEQIELEVRAAGAVPGRWGEIFHREARGYVYGNQCDTCGNSLERAEVRRAIVADVQAEAESGVFPQMLGWVIQGGGLTVPRAHWCDGEAVVLRCDSADGTKAVPKRLDVITEALARRAVGEILKGPVVCLRQ